MKQLIKVLCVVMLSIFVLSVIAKADYPSSVAKQKEVDAQIMTLLESNNLEQLKEYIDSIPDCKYLEDKQTPEFCTFDRIDGKCYMVHVFNKDFQWKERDFTAVSIESGIYTALKRIYSTSYHKDSRTFDINTYRDFYNRYRATWLSERVEKILINIWQKGDFLDKYSDFSAMSGQSIYTTLYVSRELGLPTYKYASSEVSYDLYVPQARRGRFHTILNEMKRKSKETNSPELLKGVVGKWFDSLISSELWDKTEQEYYKGKKQERMYRMFNEEGWDMFAEAGVTPNDWRIHSITLYVRACRRVLKNEKICSAFEEGAAKHGFYIPPEKIAEQQEQELNEAINRTSGKFDKGYFKPYF